MQRALSSGLTGLRANQQYLDVVGNNLANVNTMGYKSSRITFTNLFSQNLRVGSGPTGSVGGVNPSQLGTGTAVGSVDKHFVQGSLMNTGRTLDLGIQGEGFFVLRDGANSYFSRVGTFDIDSSNRLVDARTGFLVQNEAGNGIQVDMNSIIAGEATSAVSMVGNLPAERTGPEVELLQSDRAFEEHQPAVASGNSGPFDLSTNDTLLVRLNNGATQTITFSAGAEIPNLANATVDEVVNFLNNSNQALADATARNNGGVLEIVSNDTGTGANILISGDPASTASSTLFPAASVGSTILGSESTATAASDLNDLSANTTDYVAGDQLVISGMRPDGTIQSLTFTYGTGAGQDGTTLGDLVTAINTAFSTGSSSTATVTLGSDGVISFTADESGEANMSLSISDAAGNTGAANWNSHFFRTITQGSGPDTVAVVSNVFDSTGTRRSVTLTYERQDDGSWNVIPSVESSEGEVESGTITGISFDQDGLLNKIPNTEIQITWNDVPGLHSFNLNLGTAGMADGVTQFGLGATVSGTADGYEAGSLREVAVRSDGVVEGFYSNGQIRDLDRIGLARFGNVEGLKDIGGSMYAMTSNSGEPVFSVAQNGSMGSIVSGSLEGSNVDIAEEFVRLIEAQRAFQANARVVSTSDEVLAELVNLL